MSKATKKVRDKWRAKEWYSVFTPSYFGEMSVASTGDRCDTILKSHEYSTDYLRSVVRRGSTRMDGIFAASTIDKYLTRVYIIAFSHGRIKGSQEHAVRQVMGKIVAQKASQLTYSQICHEMVLGKMGSDVYNEAKKVCPLRHVGVRK